MSELDDQVALFRRLLEGKRMTRDSPAFGEIINWIRHCPLPLGGQEAISLRELVCSCFGLQELEFYDLLRSSSAASKAQADYASIEEEFDALVPKEGFLRNYVEFTRNLESPFAYHLYCALVGVGAVINRQVYLDMGGYFKIFPALGVILLGPSGVKKNTAGDIVVGLLQEAELVKIYQEKITPEGLVEAMKGENNAVGLAYAPELAVFLGKQKYMEGVIPLLTRFMDCPTSWSSATIMRGNSVLRNIGISCLFGSTPDWFIKNTPADTFGGGFIARYLLVVQSGTARIFPVPLPVPAGARGKLLEQLVGLGRLAGQAVFSDRLYYRNGSGKDSGVYAQWYREYKTTSRNPEHELLTTYLERKPIHVLRLALIFHLATHGDLTLCEECFGRALKLCTLSESFLPALLKQMFKSLSGEEQELVVNYIRKAGGVITHTELVRKLQWKMRAEQTKAVVSSLKEAELVKEVRDNFSRRYILVELDAKS